MPGTPEKPIPVEETYREILKAAVAAVGGQYKAAELAGVDQATISRTLKKEARATYTTLRKLADALPDMPDPVISVRDAEHARWCQLGAVLAEHRPDTFKSLLGFAELSFAEIAALEAPHRPNSPTRPSDAAIQRLKATISSPVAKRRK